MIGGTARRRGQPLAALLLVLGCWTGVRAMTWDGTALTMKPPVAKLLPVAVRADRAPGAGLASAVAPAPIAAPISVIPQGWPGWAVEPEAGFAAAATPANAPAGPSTRTYPALAGAPPQPRGTSLHGGWFHFLLPGRRAGFSEDAPAGLTAESRDGTRAATIAPGGNAAPHPNSLAARIRASRAHWSGDAWMLLRRNGADGAVLSNGPAPGTYGASQAGAVLRYAFAPGSRLDPRGYLRVASAVGGIDDSEVALGVSARPFAKLPVVAGGELRANRSGGHVRLRPAALVVTQLPPIRLPYNATAEAYLQGGYVAGRFSTAFVDGQVRVDTPLATVGKAKLRIGGGAWGGAQRDASRLDVGPGATLGLPLRGNAVGRVAIDYRLRVAGHADPGSGPALTVSAGF